MRVIHHLSLPVRRRQRQRQHRGRAAHSSAASGTPPALCARSARGCLLVKLDVEAAYKQVPVRREDWPLLGFKWQGKWYYERMLPFGLRSSCRLWELYATALHYFFSAPRWRRATRVDRALRRRLPLRRRSRAGARRRCATLRSRCARSSACPWRPTRRRGRRTCLTFLGIELDTSRHGGAPVAPSVCASCSNSSVDWGREGARDSQGAAVARRACSTSRAQSCGPGGFYLRRLIDHTIAMSEPRSPGALAPCPLPAACARDIAWWARFLRGAGTASSLLYELEWERADRIELFTDACDNGYGAYSATQWFAGAWSPARSWRRRMRAQAHSMPFLELHALVQAAATWGAQLARQEDHLPLRLPASRAGHRALSQPQPGHDAPAAPPLSPLACAHGFDFRCEHIAGGH